MKKVFLTTFLLLFTGFSAKATTQESTEEASAVWISTDTIVLPDRYPQADKFILTSQSEKESEFRLLKKQGKVGNSDSLLKNYPYLKGYTKLQLSELAFEKKHKLLKNKLKIQLYDQSGKLLHKTGLQNYGILDELFTYSGNDLGLSFDASGNPRLKLWSPVAQKVRVHLYDSSTAITPVFSANLTEGENGLWSVIGNKNWKEKFYLYEIFVYSPYTGKDERNLVTDPYSVSLSVNSKRSQIVDLNEQKLKPEGWNELKKPELKKPEDISIYELHLRDFSSNDPLVKKEYIGKFLAFTQDNSFGINHLRNLAQAGLSHLHLLPVFDLASIEEKSELQKEPQIPVNLPSDSPLPQKIISGVKDQDAYNWGYDPYHYFVPEGSYATDPDGSARILEFRQMLTTLNRIKLRVIMDVVFNHTFAYGQNPKSVLDKIVPGYYYRLDSYGRIQQTTCCPDTASERKMMAKLMTDALVFWAKNYKIDGFRFDLLGHHAKENLREIQKKLAALTLEKDGVDGKKIYLYGEGWQFGSLDAILPKEAFNQQNSYGFGIGTFNDRLRDSARGGNFSHSTKSDQGFISGLYLDDNQSAENTDTSPDPNEQKKQLFNYQDNIRFGLAGNLRNYQLLSGDGQLISGADLTYRGSPGAAYAADPQETINYLSIHDNYTLWDQISAKVPFQKKGRTPPTATAEEKTRRQNLGLSLVALAQGIPIFDAGADLLRSKSGDGDSYNSGDYFNRLDFSFQNNNWGVGLPPEEKNGAEWSFWQKRLASPELKPSRENILASVAHFQKLLKIRYDSELFRLPNEKEIIKRVKFLNTGKNQIPGLLVMKIADDQQNLDPQKKMLLVFFNASRETLKFKHPDLRGLDLKIHPELLRETTIKIPEKTLRIKADPLLSQANFIPKTGEATIPPLSTVIFYQPD